MKKLFKKAVASFLAAALAVTSMVTSIAAADLTITGEGYADGAVSVAVEASVVLTVETTSEITATPEDSSKATATPNNENHTVTITGVAEGSTTVDIAAGSDSATVTVTVTAASTPEDPEEPEEPSGPATITLATEGGAAAIAYVGGDATHKALSLTPSATAKNKFVAVVTGTAATPTVSNGKPATDSSVKDIAKVSVKNGKVIVAAGKKSGTVYVHLFDIMGDKSVAQQTATGMEVKIKGAPTAFAFYGEDPNPSEDEEVEAQSEEADKPAKIKSAVVASKAADAEAVGTTIYFEPIVKGTGNVLADDATYTVEPDTKTTQAGYITVEYTSGTSFVVKAAKSIKPADGKTKTVSGKIVVTNEQSGKKGTIAVIVENGIVSIANEIQSGYATVIDEKGDVSKVDVDTTLDDASTVTTSKVSVVVLNGEADFNERGKQTTAKSKLFAAKLQSKGTDYRIRITNSGAKDAVITSAGDTQYVYLVVTNAAKQTEYKLVATIAKATSTVTAYVAPTGDNGQGGGGSGSDSSEPGAGEPGAGGAGGEDSGS